MLKIFFLRAILLAISSSIKKKTLKKAKTRKAPNEPPQQGKEEKSSAGVDGGSIFICKFEGLIDYLVTLQCRLCLLDLFPCENN